MKRVTRFLAMLALAASIGCDYLKPKEPPAKKELSTTEKFNLAERCSVAGKKYFEEFAAGWNNSDSHFMWSEPEYHYNSRLNTCLVHIRFVRGMEDGSWHYNQTMDVFSNKAILYGWFARNHKNWVETVRDVGGGNDAPNYTSVEYFRQKDILFNE